MKRTQYIKTGIASIALYSTVAIGAVSTLTMAQMANAATPPTATIQTVAIDQDSVQPIAISETAASGTFTGRSKHVTKGDVRVIKTAAGYELSLSENFFLDGAPDPVIGFGNNGKYNADSQFTQLNKKQGAQTYKLPAEFTPSNFSQVFIWCEKFSVPLGVAELN